MFQVSGPSFITQDGLGFFTVTKKNPNLSALNNKGLFLADATCPAGIDSGLALWHPPNPGPGLTEVLPFGDSPDSQHNEENLENRRMALTYFCPKVTKITSAHLSRPWLISSVGQCASPMCSEWRGTGY